MPAPTTSDELLELVRKSGVVDEKRLDAYVQKLRAAAAVPADVGKLSGVMVRDGVLTHFQAEQLIQGKWRRFTIGKYKVLEKLGSGGMGLVYLCEHKFMRRRVAVKILPTAKAEESSSLERFYREARAVAALDHANIVRAYDIDQDDKLHFLVMEYIDGASLHEMVKRHGPMDIIRAAHYIRQAALGLQHAHQAAGLVHRDIKPGNILVDRLGVVKVLDMGLARFFNDEESLITKKYDENVLGTADYLAPEQAIDSHGADIRADIYSLGATFYYCLTGSAPFSEGTVAQKLIWHQTRPPKPVRSLRPEVPPEMAAVLEKMMAKEPAQRFQTPVDVVEALAPWTREMIPPPPEKEMPRLSPAIAGTGSMGEGSGVTPTIPGAGMSSPTPRPAGPATPGFRPLPGTPGQPGQVTPRPTTAAASLASPAPQYLPHGAATPATTATPDEEHNSHVSWDRLAPDTDDATARGDTAPRSISRHLPAAWSRRRRNWWVVGGITGTCVVALIVTLLSLPGSPDNTRQQRAPAVLQVTRTPDQPGSFKTVREALAHAKPGDRIVVLDEKLEETLSLEEGDRGKNVTIEAGRPDHRVHWVCPATKEGKFFVLTKVEGLHLKGFTLDGLNRAKELVRITGHCPGLVLEDMHLQGFTQAGVALWNCTGDADKDAVTLKDLRFTTSGPVEAALSFNANSRVIPPVNQNIVVSDCRFEGPFLAAVLFAGAAVDVDMHRNRFFHSVDGLLYIKATPRFKLQLKLDSNTFYEIQKVGLHFQGMPLSSDKSRVELQNNLFGRTPALAQADELDQLDKVGLIFIYRGNVDDPESKEGNLRLSALTKPFSLPTNPAEDATFLLYPKTSDLAHSGVDQHPAGAPPRD